MPKPMVPDDFIAACRPFVAVSHETIHRLKIYADLLAKWQTKINLVSASTLPDLWHRHFLDSAQLVKFFPAESVIADIGSGAGFPGLVLAAFGYRVTMIESDQKKVAFMAEVVRQAGIKTASFQNCRIEKANIFKVDIVTARALADVSQLLDYAAPFMGLGAKGLFLKGSHVTEELTLAAQKWHMDTDVSPSLTDPDASVLLVRKATRRD